MTDKIIRGSGGPPPSPPSPTRAPDTLNSRQFASIQDLLSEGEIEGFATPSKAGLTKGSAAYNNAALKDIFLNDTPILQSSANNAAPETSKFNFQNVGFTPRFGTGNQTHIPGIQQSQSPLSGFTSTLCSKGNNGVTRSLPTGKDAVKVTITFAQIQKATDQGDLLGSTVELKISLRVNNEVAFTQKITDIITGRTADAYSKEYRVNLPDGYSSADVRVERVTNDQTPGGDIVDAFNVSSIQLLIDDKQRYLNSAYTNLRIDSEQFSSIPKRAFRIRGVKVRVPGAGSNVVSANYSQAAFNVTVGNNNHGLSVGDKIFFDATSGNGVDGTYTIILVENANSFVFQSGTSQTVGVSTCTYTAIPRVDLQTGRIIYPSGYIFNGTMGAAVWCSCPAMILLDLLTTERYGFGTHITDSNLDLFSFVAASKYANELVDDGFGGQEARFSCNVNLQGSMEAYQLINELAGVMRCFPIWSEGSVTITQDKPTDPSYLFSLANVGEGGFSYSGSSLKTRHSVISVSYFNMDSREIDYEIVEDIAAQAKLGIVKKDVKAFATTSRGQAQRLGKAILFSEQNESETVTFTTSIDAGAIVRPGSVIAVNDPVRSLERRSGRINTATTTQITVDDTKDLSNFTGTDRKCSVILPNGSVETKNVIGLVNNVITLDSALSAIPNVNSIWLLQSSTLEAQTFRVIAVEEQDGINYAITALTYIDGKYNNIEQGIALPERTISLLNEPRDPPSNLKISDQNGESKEMIVVRNGLAVSKLLLTWVPVTGVSQYLVQYRFNNTNWVSEIVFRPDFELLNTEAGTYEFKVFSYNAALKLSATSSDLTFNAVGKTAPPGNVLNLSIEPITNKLVRLRWTKSVDPDVLHGGRVYIRHSNLTDGSGTFQNSVNLVTALPGNSTDAIVPSLEGEYILKFQDDQGNFSVGEASIIQDLPDLIDTQVILQDREDLDVPPFQGVDINTFFNTTTSALQLSNAATHPTGEYAFKDILDLGAVFSLDLKRVIRSIGFNIGTDIETIIPAGSLWDDYATDGNFDGPLADKVNCEIQVATSQAASGSFGDFNNFANGTYKGRRFKFKLVLESESPTQNMNVQQAGYTAEFESRTERKYQVGASVSTAPQQSGTSAKAIVFANPFFTGTTELGGSTTAFLPAVGITIQNAISGDFFTVTNVSGTGFTVSIKNGTSFVDRTFTFQAVGYGKGV